MTQVSCTCGATWDADDLDWHPTHTVYGEEVMLCADDTIAGWEDEELEGTTGAYSLHEWHQGMVWPRIRRYPDGRWADDLGDHIDDVTAWVREINQEEV